MPRQERFGILPPALKNRLKDAPSGAFVWFGPEELLKQFYLEKWITLIEKEGMADFNLVRLDFSDGILWEDLAREIDTPPVMAPHRLILCRAFAPASLSAGDVERLAEILRDFPDYAILIFYLEQEEFSADKKTLAKKTVQRLSEFLTFCSFPLQDEKTLTAWANKILARDGLSVTPGAVRSLIRLCDGKMAPMRGELEKIACFCLAKNKTTATEEEVLLFARDTRDFAVYQWCDAVLDGAARPAETFFQNLMRQKTDPLILAAALSRLLANCLYVMDGAGEEEMMKLTGLKSWQYERYRRALQGKKKENVARALSLCLTLDRDLKSGSGNGEMICEKTMLAVTRLLGGAA